MNDLLFAAICAAAIFVGYNMVPTGRLYFGEKPMNDLRIQLRLLTEARRDRLFVLARREGVSPSDWLRGAIGRASAPRNDEEPPPTYDHHWKLIGPWRTR